MKVNFNTEDTDVRDKNQICFPYNEKLIIQEEIEKLENKQVIRKVQNCEGQIISNIFAREKKDGSLRMILNLKDMNKLIDKVHFKMETLEAAISLMKEGCYFTSIDLKDAYFSVSIHPEFRKFFRFRFNEDLYEFVALPQGFKESPRIFTKLLKPILGFLRSQGHELVAYIDDSLIKGDSKEQCISTTKEAARLFDGLGFTVHPSKSSFEPDQRILFLGFILCSISMTVSVSDEKAKTICNFIEDILEMTNISIRKFAKVIGCLVALNPGVWIGPIFWRRLEIEKLESLRRNCFNFEAKMTLSNTSIEDLKWWLSNIQKFPKPVHRNIPNIVLYTDASKQGWGATKDGTSTGGMWLDSELSEHINVLELKAALFGLKALCAQLSNTCIKLMTDNSTTVASINKMGSTKVACNNVARQIWLWCLERDIFLLAAHIPGIDNITADEESRKDRSSAEWKLEKGVFLEVENKFGPFCVDLFASRVNAQTDIFVAWKPDPEAWMVNAFSINWDLKGLYCFPPFILISRILSKVQEEGAKMTIIAPLWRNQVWFPKMMKMLIDYPMLLPNRKDILMHPMTKENPKIDMRLMACSISGVTSEAIQFQKVFDTSCVQDGDHPQQRLITPTLKDGFHFVLRGKVIPWIQM